MPDSRSKRTLALLVFAGIVAFGIAMRFRGALNPWWANAGIAAVVLPLGLWVMTARRRLTMPRPALVGAGVLVGGVMVGVTQLAVPPILEALPSLRATVAELYASIGNNAPGYYLTLALIAAVVAAEEILFRGVAIELFGEERCWKAATASTTLYAIPQLIGGIWLLVLAAVLLGFAMALLRLHFRSLVPAIIAHLLWSASIFHVWPLV